MSASISWIIINHTSLGMDGIGWATSVDAQGLFQVLCFWVSVKSLLCSGDLMGCWISNQGQLHCKASILSSVLSLWLQIAPFKGSPGRYCSGLLEAPLLRSSNLQLKLLKWTRNLNFFAKFLFIINNSCSLLILHKKLSMPVIWL